jgi:hypothetical protein
MNMEVEKEGGTRTEARKSRSVFNGPRFSSLDQSAWTGSFAFLPIFATADRASDLSRREFHRSVGETLMVVDMSN